MYRVPTGSESLSRKAACAIFRSHGVSALLFAVASNCAKFRLEEEGEAEGEEGEEPGERGVVDYGEDCISPVTCFVFYSR